MPLFAFDNTYARLPDRFYARVRPTPVRAPHLVKVNRALAAVLQVAPERLETDEGARIVAGNDVPEGAEPIAQAYAGHQFGAFVPQLGDGRAILLGEVVGSDGVRRDVQLKGAGRTPFSRGGDGRAAIGPVLREYVVSEAMAALGVPTTRSLALATTGEAVIRERRLPGAVLTRVAASHIRVGTFEYFAAREDTPALALLVDYSLARHAPANADAANKARALLDHVIERQAALIPLWLGLGFIHGVMNTDNTLISGETIDYGPCAFLDEFDPRKTFSSIDEGGRYAFGNQAAIANWNLARFAETLLPLLADDEKEAVRLAVESLERFPALFQAKYTAVLRGKLGLAREEADDRALADAILRELAANRVDYTVFFRELGSAAAEPGADARLAALFANPSAFTSWAAAWRQRLAREDRPVSAIAAGMRRTNPRFIPRNHRIEQAITAAADNDDWEPFETLLRVLEHPYDDQPESAHLAEPPAPEERVLRTFCGT